MSAEKARQTPSDHPAGPEGALVGTELVDSLVQLSFAVQAVFGQLAESQEMSIPQARMLGVLEDREIGVQELSEILEQGKSSTSGLVSRAERRGLVRRRDVPGDGRAVHVALTPAGRALVRTVREAVRAEITRLAEPLSGDDRAELARAAQVLVDRYAEDHRLPI